MCDDRAGAGNETNVTRLVKLMNEQNLLPAIIFSFSRNECEAYATTLKNVDFNDSAK